MMKPVNTLTDDQWRTLNSGRRFQLGAAPYEGSRVLGVAISITDTSTAARRAVSPYSMASVAAGVVA